VSITDLYNPALKCMSSPTKPVFVAKHLLSSKPDGVVVKTTSIGESDRQQWAETDLCR